MRWKTWNDQLALLIILIIPTLWGLQARNILNLAPEVTGALIATWTLVLQYYFRTAPPKDTPPGP